QPAQHLIEECRIAARSRDFEGVEYPVLKNIGIVEGNATVELRTLACEVTSLNCEITRELARERDVETLNVGSDPIRVVSGPTLRALRERNRRERNRANRNRQT